MKTIIPQKNSVLNLILDTDNQETNLVTFDREGNYTCNIIASNASLNKIFIHTRTAKNLSIEIILELQDNAKLDLYLSTFSSQQENIKFNINSHCQQNSQLNITTIQNDNTKSSINISNQLNEVNSEVNVYSLLVGKQKSYSKIAIENISKTSQTKSNIVMRTILFDSATGKIQGNPIVKLGAQNCSSHLNQQTLLLSKQARIIAQPQLTIANNDVDASHSSSVTSFNENDLYYLETRGLNRDQAAHLMIEGFINEVIESISDPKIKQEIKCEVDQFIK